MVSRRQGIMEQAAEAMQYISDLRWKPDSVSRTVWPSQIQQSGRHKTNADMKTDNTEIVHKLPTPCSSKHLDGVFGCPAISVIWTALQQLSWGPVQVALSCYLLTASNLGNRDSQFGWPEKPGRASLKWKEAGSLYVDLAHLQIWILLPQPPVCWDYRFVPLCLL